MAGASAGSQGWAERLLDSMGRYCNEASGELLLQRSLAQGVA